MTEHERERAHADVGHVGLQQARVGVRNQHADHEDREHVEQQDAPEDLADRTRDRRARVFRFAGCDADHFGALKRKAGDHRDAHHRRQAADERRVADREVREARARAALHDPEDHQQTDPEKRDHGQHLDQREPVFGLAEAAHRQCVEREDQRQKERAPPDTRYVREPVVHHELRGDQFDGERDGPAVPVVPAEREAEAFVDELRAVGRERARHRHECGHFAEARHQEIHHQPDHHVGEHRAAGAGLRDRRAGRDEQARADRAADRDHPQMARLQAAVEGRLRGARTGRTGRIGAGI
ncbi:hypothetical protein FEP58_04512 [Burkholderia multivorans]|nr:hypothetical protein [Burkholderia multivorans]